MNKNRRQILNRIASLTIGIPLALSLASCVHPSGRRKRRPISGYTIQSTAPRLRWAVRYHRLIVPSPVLVLGTQVELPDERLGRIQSINVSQIALIVDDNLIEYEYQLG